MIRVSAEGPRGCGYRKVGGLYLVSDGPGVVCGGLPLIVEKCTACGGGIKPARAWTWIEPQELFGTPTHECGQAHCYLCPVTHPPERAGLIWIGEGHYKTPRDFTREAEKMGVSRRIVAVPKDFKLGETWVFLAHRKGTQTDCECRAPLPHLPQPECEKCRGSGFIYRPAIFHIFRPSRVEQVVPQNSTEDGDEIKALRKRGIEPVIVQKLGEQGELLTEPE